MTDRVVAAGAVLFVLVAVHACGGEQRQGPASRSGVEGSPSADSSRPALPAPPADRRPRAVVRVGEHDFGDVLEGTDVSATYRIANEGEGRLQVSSVRSQCGCTQATIEPDQLGAGETAEVTVTFQSAHRRGRQDRDVLLKTNDPERPFLRLHMKARVYRIIEPRPAVLDFGEVFRGEEATAWVELSSRDGSRFAIQAVECKDPLVSARCISLAASPNGESRFRIDATLAATAPAGFTSTVDVVAQVDHEVHSQIHIPVRAKVKLPVSIEPEKSLDFGTLARGEGAERIVTVKNLRPEAALPPPDVRVESSANRLQADPQGGGFREFIVAQLRVVEAGQHYEIAVRVDGELPLPRFIGVLKIGLGSGHERPYIVAVHGLRGP